MHLSPMISRRCGRPCVDVIGIPFRVLRASDILDHKLALRSGASVENPIDEKHYVDARRLGAVCGRDVPSLAVSRLAGSSYSHNVDEACFRCQISQHRGFPLASKRAIFDILGYV